jgi:hypothetical protein
MALVLPPIPSSADTLQERTKETGEFLSFTVCFCSSESWELI